MMHKHKPSVIAKLRGQVAHFSRLLSAMAILTGLIGCYQTGLPPRILLAAGEQHVPCFIDSGRVFVLGTMGQNTVPFMIDTADYEGVTITEALAKEAGLHADCSGTFMDKDYGGGSAPAMYVRLSSLMMGAAEIRGLNGIAVGTPSFRSGTDAILGWPAFTDVLFTIDYARNQLILRHGQLPPADGNHVLRLERDHQGFLTASASFDGKRVQLCLDSGSTSSCMCLTKAQALELNLKWHSPPSAIAVHTFFHDVNSLRGEAEGDLRIGDFAVTNPTVIVWDVEDAPMTLGSEFLGKFAVTFDFKDMRIEIEPSSPLIPTFFPDLTFRCEHRHVISIDPGGPAACAGIHVGDEIVLMNGEANTIIEPDSPHLPGTEIVHGPATVTGPATWSLPGYSSEIPEGQMVNFAEGVTVTVSYHRRSTTTAATTKFGSFPGKDSALIMNWPVDWNGPLPLQIRRGGRLLWISLPIKSSRT